LSKVVSDRIAGVLRQRLQQAEQLRQQSDRPTFSGLQAWSKHFLPVNFSKPASSMHTWLFARCDEFAATRGNRVNVIGPRGGAKSTIGTTALVLRSAVEGWEPLIWIIMETKDQAIDELRKIKDELVENEQLARAYPEACGKGSVWQDKRIRMRNGVVIEAYGSGQKIRGRKAGAHRPSLIVCDDIQGDQVMTSANRRERDWTWFDGTLLKAGNKSTNVLNLATALHRDAIALRLDRTPGWESRIFPSVSPWPPTGLATWSQWSEVYFDLVKTDRKAAARRFFEKNETAIRAGVTVLWPEEEDLQTLMQQWAINPSTFQREKQGRPINPEDCEWPESYFEDVYFDEWPKQCEVKALVLDPSKGKDARRSDYSAFVWGMFAGGCIYVDADLARRPPRQIVEDGISIYRRFLPHVFGVEANAMQELFLDQFEREFLTHDMHVRIAPIFNTGNKRVRIRTLGGPLGARQIRFRRGSEGVALLLSQLRDFPDPHTHDDGPDALEMLVALVTQWLRDCRAPEDQSDHVMVGAA
jgi:hypothetical protein